MSVSGYIKPGALPVRGKPATLMDVCEHTGLSTATVSRVLNNSPRVRESTRRKVLAAMNDLGYMANHSARSLARRHTDTLGVIFPDIDSGFFSQVLRGINQIAAAEGFTLMVAFSLGSDSEVPVVRQYLSGGRVDGLILMNLGMPEDFIRSAAWDQLPIVLIDRPVPGADVPTVTIDNITGAESAMSHIIERGYKQIAIIRGPENTYDAEERFLGCTQCAARAGLGLAPELIWSGDFTEQSGYDATKAWMSRGRPLPEVIFALNDQMAMGAMEALQEAGLSVPKDVALVGFDDIKPSRLFGLTTVHSPTREMGELACRAAISMIRGEGERDRQVLPTHLVVRDSCPQKR